jgi:hypothetical protein
MRNILTFFIFVLSAIYCKAQNIYTMSQTFNINTSGELNYVEIKGFLPNNKQRVIDIRFSDSRIKQIDRRGIKYFQFKEQGFIYQYSFKN